MGGDIDGIVVAAVVGASAVVLVVLIAARHAGDCHGQTVGVASLGESVQQRV